MKKLFLALLTATCTAYAVADSWKEAQIPFGTTYYNPETFTGSTIQIKSISNDGSEFVSDYTYSCQPDKLIMNHGSINGTTFNTAEKAYLNRIINDQLKQNSAARSTLNFSCGRKAALADINLIRYAIKKTDEIYRENGMIGLQSAVESCYSKTPSARTCLYLDMGATAIDASFSALLPEVLAQMETDDDTSLSPNANLRTPYFEFSELEKRADKYLYKPQHTRFKDKESDYFARVEVFMSEFQHR